MRNSQKFTVGTGKRIEVVSKSLATVPGPGNYRISLFNKT
jgi:hypothetical protein